jgi:hypothetical protein
MKKSISLSLLVSTCFFLIISCKKPNLETNTGCESLTSVCYKGRLEIKGICGNLTVKVLDPKFPSSLMENDFRNPITSETLTNVFAVKNICDFPNAINEGDEFYFILSSGSKNVCMLCKANYPTPNIANDITVLPAPCNYTTD